MLDDTFIFNPWEKAYCEEVIFLHGRRKLSELWANWKCLAKIKCYIIHITSWFETNKIYEDARLLTYAQFIIKFVYVKQTRSWKPRKRGYTVGRLIWVFQITRVLYYLRMMLYLKKWSISYNDINKVDDFL